MINTWTTTSFPFTIDQGGIENCSQGYIIIEWEWTYLDEEGVSIVTTDVSEIDDIPFTAD